MDNHEGKQLQNFAKIHTWGIEGLASRLDQTRGNLYYYFKKDVLDKEFKEKVAGIYKLPVQQIWPSNTDIQQSEGDRMRAKKAFGESEDEGIIYVPITAQAGYTKSFTEPVFLDQLKRWQIPDFPYKGDKYRVFEVEGDSMQYLNEKMEIRGLLNGYQVVGERVEDWKYTVQFYVHVIVFEDTLVIKRLYRDDATKTFVLISDNQDYGQKRIPMDSVKELWIMKRYMGWDMSPPIKYKITV